MSAIGELAWCEDCDREVEIVDDFEDQIGWAAVRVYLFDCGHDRTVRL